MWQFFTLYIEIAFALRSIASQGKATRGTGGVAPDSADGSVVIERRMGANSAGGLMGSETKIQ